MKIQPLLSIAAVGLLALGAQTSKAIPTVNSAECIGYFTPAINPGGGGLPSNMNVNYLNDMIDYYDGITPANNFGETFTVLNGGTFGPLATASSLSGSGNGTEFSGNGLASDVITYNSGTYIIGQWDGNNGADAVYYLGTLNLTSGEQIDLVNDLFPNSQGNGYLGLSGYWVGEPGSPSPLPAPDGGTTIVMLGSALTGLAFVSRRFRRS